MVEERNKIFAIALCPFDKEDPIHFRLLVTIYRSLTVQLSYEIRRFGNHWENIGFQGTDPATDLRGVGILGLYQILYFVLSKRTQKISQKIYKLSLDNYQQFPFCVMSTNLTAMALQILREGRLNKLCNRAKSVDEVFNQVYSGLFIKMFQIWKREKKSIKDAGFVLKGNHNLTKSIK